ncbi:MAG TPA: hypothetical protein VJ579_04315 [Candidatus Paceibacterota bacterium]|nr:hypothetical protein [Candidatus Paceibacterota bacterium]
MVFCLLLPSTLYAQEEFHPEGFSAEPAILRVSVERGGQFRSFFSLLNSGDTALTLDILVADFVPINSTGGVQKMEGIPEKDDPVRASGWFSIPEGPLIVPPRQKLRVPFSISVPSDANPGGRSVVIELETRGGSARERMNMLNFVTVPGEAKEQLTILSFGRDAIMTATAHGTFSLLLKNDGETHLRPEGEVVVRNMFGVERGRYSLEGLLAPGTIIPNAKRSVEYKWVGSLSAFDFGLWNARVALRYGEGGANSVGDRTFFLVLPWRAFLLIVFILGGSVRFFMYAVARLRKDLAHISIDNDGAAVERTVSVQLLIIPFIAGLLLLVVVTGTMFSLLSGKNEGSFERVQKVNR